MGSRMAMSAGCSVRSSAKRKIEINSCRKTLTSTVVNAEAGVAYDTEGKFE
jgi:hypothetical protein